MEKKDLPLVVLRPWAKMLDIIRFEVDRHSDIMSIVEDTGTLIRVIDKDNKLYFNAFDPFFDRKGGKGFVKLAYKPVAENNSAGTEHPLGIDEAIAIFNFWVSVVKEFDETPLTREEKFLKQFENEFSNENELLDEDADNATFEQPKLEYLYKLLTDVEGKIASDYPHDEALQKVKEDATDLKENLQNLTKRQVHNRLKKMYANIKKHGMKFLKDVWDAAKKEGIKKMLNEGGEFIGDQLGNMQF